MKQLSIKPLYNKSKEVENVFSSYGGELKLDLAKEVKTINEKLHIYWGLSGTLGFLREFIDSRAYNAYKITKKQMGLSASLFTSVDWQLSDRVYVELAVNYFSWSIFADSTYIDNPILSASRKRVTDFDFDLWGQRSFQIGFGYNLGTNNP